MEEIPGAIMRTTVSKPCILRVLRCLGILAVLAWSCCIVGAYRTTRFGFEMEVVWAQLFLSFLFTAPLCLVVGAKLSWLYKIALFCFATFSGIVFGHFHAAIQEAAVIRKYGEHPPARIVVHRWFPYTHNTVSYEPQMKVWIGDD